MSEAKHFDAAGDEAQIGLAAFGAGGGGVDHQPGGFDLHRHVGQHELDGLERADRLAELLAFVGVGNFGVQRTLGDAHRLRADRRAGVIQRCQRGLEPGAALTDDFDRPGCGSSRSTTRSSASL